VDPISNKRSNLAQVTGSKVNSLIAINPAAINHHPAIEAARVNRVAAARDETGKDRRKISHHKKAIKTRITLITAKMKCYFL
jgi:hypothetical protein